MNALISPNAVRIALCCFAPFLVCLLGACYAELEPDVGSERAGLCRSEDSDPDTDVSFEHDILPLFERESGNAGCSCHLPDSPRPFALERTGLDLSRYQGLFVAAGTDSEALVPGEPCESLLVQKVSNAPPYGSRMPSDGPPYLSPEETQLLRDWIFEGARDN